MLPLPYAEEISLSGARNKKSEAACIATDADLELTLVFAATNQYAGLMINRLSVTHSEDGCAYCFPESPLAAMLLSALCHCLDEDAAHTSMTCQLRDALCEAATTQ